MNGNLRILLLLFAFGISISFTQRALASADIGYRDGLMVRATIKVKGRLYVQAEKYDFGEKYGIGIGYKSNNFNVILMTNQIVEDVKSFNGEIKASYYDGNYDVFTSFGYSDNKEFSYELGAGYPLTEKFSLILSYSEKGAVFGARSKF